MATLSLKFDLKPVRTAVGAKIVPGVFTAMFEGHTIKGTRESIETEIRSILARAVNPQSPVMVSNGKEFGVHVQIATGEVVTYSGEIGAGILPLRASGWSQGNPKDRAGSYAVHLARLATTIDDPCPEWVPEENRDDFETLQRYNREERALRS